MLCLRLRYKFQQKNRTAAVNRVIYRLITSSDTVVLRPIIKPPTTLTYDLYTICDVKGLRHVYSPPICITLRTWKPPLTFDGRIGMVVTRRYLAAPSLLQAGTVAAAVLGLDFDRSGPGHRAGTAVGVARRPWTPRGHLAIHHCNRKSFQQQQSFPKQTQMWGYVGTNINREYSCCYNFTGIIGVATKRTSRKVVSSVSSLAPHRSSLSRVCLLCEICRHCWEITCQTTSSANFTKSNVHFYSTF